MPRSTFWKGEPMSTRTRWRVLSALALAFAVTTGVSAAPASAAVFDHCTMVTCADARAAFAYWDGEGLPPRRVTNTLPGRECITGGGTYGNRDEQLPEEDKGTYREFDVYSRPCGKGRDAHRIVVNHETGDAWYTDDHYRNFHLL
ncbi:putative secreted protein [Saccharothrix espanaensis DSM 44229]|uniref:Putative secreted protein n=2 Tax=Saccharothrix espanaensis TaxID=103731 RepID=K0JXW0_SACES|nr:putative secreted protein [Saccharothrix espanaensis DSM 44229]